MAVAIFSQWSIEPRHAANRWKRMTTRGKQRRTVVNHRIYIFDIGVDRFIFWSGSTLFYHWFLFYPVVNHRVYIFDIGADCFLFFWSGSTLFYYCFALSCCWPPHIYFRHGCKPVFIFWSGCILFYMLICFGCFVMNPDCPTFVFSTAAERTRLPWDLRSPGWPRQAPGGPWERLREPGPASRPVAIFSQWVIEPRHAANRWKQMTTRGKQRRTEDNRRENRETPQKAFKS